MKDFFKKIKPYAIPGIITCLTMVVVLILKGIWPFGSNRIDYFDNMQQVAPLYTHLWDWMHGNADLWFDWYTGLGTNLAMSTSAFTMISPFNLLLYLIPRDLILESVSILTIVKMTFMAVAMYAFINRKFKNVGYSLKVCFSLMYAFCGYVVLYGSAFTPWMDIVALFPVLMIALDILYTSGKKLFYIFMVALLFIMNYYLSAMALVYILVTSGIFILLTEDKSKWKNHAWNLGIGTIAGMALSCITLIPVFMQLSTSQRGGATNGLLGQYKNWLLSSVINDGAMAALQRYMMLFGLTFVIAIIVRGLKANWHNRKQSLIMGLLTLVAISPMFVECINLIWHFGSYNGYTLRNGFLISFTLICVAAYYANNGALKEMSIEKKDIIKQIAGVVVIGLIYGIGYNLIPQNNEYIAGGFFFVVFVVALVIHFKGMGKDTYNYKLFFGLIGIELFIGCYSFVGLPKFYTYDDYQVGDYVQIANDVTESLGIEESATDRIINPDISLNANYPLMMRRGALSSFTAALESDSQTSAKKLGYSKYFLWMLDSGGTVFSDALFHITEAVNANELDSALYTKERTADDYSLYSANYQLPFALPVSSKFKSADKGSDWITSQNAFYKALSGDEEDLITGVTGMPIKSSSTVTYNLAVEKNQALYMNIVDVNNRNSDANVSWLISSMHIYVNGEAIKIPTLGDVNNTAYFTDYNNNLVYLGTFDSESVEVRIEYDDPWYLKVSEITIAQLSMDKMQTLCDSFKDYRCEVSYTDTSLTVVINGSALKNYVLLPVINSQNWTVKVDGKVVKADKVEGLFTGVTVHSGECVITMEFEPKGLKEGMLISIATLVLIILLTIFNHFRTIKIAKPILYIAEFIYLQIMNVVVLAMFVVPLIAVVPALLFNIVKKLMGLF